MKLPLSVSARDMVLVLDEDGPEAKALRDTFHRTLLWRWCKARKGVPNTENIFRIESLTGGRVTAHGWNVLVAKPKAQKAPESPAVAA